MIVYDYICTSLNEKQIYPNFGSKDLTIDLSIFRAFGHIEASELHYMMLFAWDASGFLDPNWK